MNYDLTSIHTFSPHHLFVSSSYNLRIFSFRNQYYVLHDLGLVTEATKAEYDLIQGEIPVLLLLLLLG